MTRGFKLPVSVLVVVYSADMQVLLIERADHRGFWQSITGSIDADDESPRLASLREVREETGLDAEPRQLADWHLTHRYEIYPAWRHRYAPGVTHNTEHVFGLHVDLPFTPQLAPAEHLRYRWLPWRDAADACFSWTNAAAIKSLPGRMNAKQ